ncbi:MAG: M23 family metallopeptidase [Alphaproteobacteria bacterium]|nr:M23 family metallopeptidase [Alphaproteobacteria bacterium]
MAHHHNEYSGLKPPRAPLGVRHRDDMTSPASLNMIMPLPRGTYRIGSGFGMRHLDGHSHFHRGQDIGVPVGTPILAPQDGVISDVLAHAGDAGNFLKMRGQTHGFGFMHLASFAPGIRNGARVRQGQIIGYVGMTGYTKGPHLHYEVYSLANGQHLDPRPIALTNARTVTLADARLITQGQTTTAAIFSTSTTAQINPQTTVTRTSTVWQMHRHANA